jgi:hypothetical protein
MKSMFAKYLVTIAIMGCMVAFGKFDFWMIVMYTIVAVGFMMMSQQRDIGGAISQHGLIGFLTMAFVGLAIINNIMAGQLITGAETQWANYYAFTQDFQLFGAFSFPVMNLQFFTHGIPALISWNFDVFGGTAQMVQYLLYSVTAVVSFVIFVTVIAYMFSSVFSLARR